MVPRWGRKTDSWINYRDDVGTPINIQILLARDPNIFNRIAPLHLHETLIFNNLLLLLLMFRVNSFKTFGRNSLHSFIIMKYWKCVFWVLWWSTLSNAARRQSTKAHFLYFNNSYFLWARNFQEYNSFISSAIAWQSILPHIKKRIVANQ